MLASAAGLGNTLITSARRLISAGRACTAAGPPRHQGEIRRSGRTSAVRRQIRRCGLVVVDQPAEDWSTADPAIDRLGDRRLRARWTQLEGSMRPLSVVVRGVLGQHPAEVPLSEDQHPVGEFGAECQYEAFGEAVRSRGSGAES